MGWGIDRELPTRRNRVIEPPPRGVVAAVAAVALSAAAFRLLLGVAFYPLDVASPDMAGVIASASATQWDAPVAKLTLTNGHVVSVLHGDRALDQRLSIGDLIIVGRDPEAWYLIGRRSAATAHDGCFSVWPDRAYSEPDAVVMVFGHWVGSGVRIPKAAAYDDDLLLYDELGHQRYTPFEFGSGVSFCLDADGRVTTFTH